MFSTIDEIFHNHTISFQQTVTTPCTIPVKSPLPGSRSTSTSLQQFLFLPIKFYEKPVSLIYKLTNPRPISTPSTLHISTNP